MCVCVCVGGGGGLVPGVVREVGQEDVKALKLTSST